MEKRHCFPTAGPPCWLILDTTGVSCPTRAKKSGISGIRCTCGVAVWGFRMHLLRTCERLGFRRATSSGGQAQQDARRQQASRPAGQQREQHQQDGDARGRSTSELLGAAPPRPGRERASCSPSFLSFPSSPSNPSRARPTTPADSSSSRLPRCQGQIGQSR